MMKRISPLESSREIWLAHKISSNFETVGVGTFFDASQFGCRKMIFVATKVIYDTYSYTISGMSREKMEMDGRNSTECQNWEKRDKLIILEIVKSLKDKIATVTVVAGFVFSRFASNPIVDDLQDKKENCSTRRGLRLDTGFVSF